MAAALRKGLGVEVEMRTGAYGEFTVLVDDEVLTHGGPLGFLGVLPSPREVVAAVRARISA